MVKYETISDIHAKNDIYLKKHKTEWLGGDKIIEYDVYGYNVLPHLELIYTNINNGIIGSRVGRLLFNIETKQFCFGLRDNYSGGMTALTDTDKGTFWNGVLMIVISI